jgi:hypothetical protein
MMQKNKIIAWLALGTAVAALSACGGGGGSSSETAGGTTTSTTPGTTTGTGTETTGPVAATSSPALMVPAGQANLTLNVFNCEREGDGENLTSTSLVIQNNGDVAFYGAIDGKPVAELSRMNFADLTSNLIEGGSVKSFLPVFNFEIKADSGRSMKLNMVSGTTGSFSVDGGAEDSYLCDRAPFYRDVKFEQSPSSTRVVNAIVKDDKAPLIRLKPVEIPTGSYAQTGNIVSWDSGGNREFLRYISFNLETAQMGHGSSINPATHTPVAWTLPAFDGDIPAFYSETKELNGNTSIAFGRSNILIQYTRYANPAANDGYSREFRFDKIPAGM